MKKNQFCICVALATVIALTGCQQPTNNANAKVETITSTRQFNDSTGTYSIHIDFPVVKDNEVLLVTLNEWIDEQLGGTYGNAENVDYKNILANTTAFLDHYIKQIVESNRKEFDEMVKDNPDFKEMGITYYDSTAIEKLAEGKNWVTFTNQRDIFRGGAHGIAPYFGQTFRKSDGRRIGWEIFGNTNDEKFQQIIKDGLVEYFELDSEAKLAEHLMNEANAYYVPLPQCPPLFTAEGITFVYNQYEIAAYAYGLPTFTVAYEKLLPFMMTTGKRLVAE
ncbi:MAG: DUF3298 domain-containing protein [Prevotella sp.]|nr:DUF3298 domain-containing protein [Prevotella sp.]